MINIAHTCQMVKILFQFANKLLSGMSFIPTVITSNVNTTPSQISAGGPHTQPNVSIIETLVSILKTRRGRPR